MNLEHEIRILFTNNNCRNCSTANEHNYRRYYRIRNIISNESMNLANSYLVRKNLCYFVNNIRLMGGQYQYYIDEIINTCIEDDSTYNILLSIFMNN
jgi:hypothetical protein